MSSSPPVTPLVPTATSPLLRRLNAVAVLEFLRISGPVIGTEVMAATGLSRPTVHTVCNDLMNLGLVTELDGRPASSSNGTGRRSRCYQLNAQAGYVVGIDLGAHKLAATLSDLRGTGVAHTVRKFSGQHAPANERIRTARRAVTTLLAEANVPPALLGAVAIGVAAPVTDDGRVIATQAYMPGMAGVDLGARIGRGHSWAVLLENDANLAVIGERWRGVACGVDDVIVLLAGERLGSGLFLDGRLVRGHGGGAGELTFLGLVKQVGDTDAIGALARLMGRQAVTAVLDGGGAESVGSLMSAAAGHPEVIEADTVFEAVRQGDPVAVRVLEDIADRMARVIGILGTLLNPELLVIGGAVAAAADVLIGPIARRLPDYTSTPPRLVATSLADQGVVLGATRLALDHLESRMFDVFPASVGA